MSKSQKKIEIKQKIAFYEKHVELLKEELSKLESPKKIKRKTRAKKN